ncbi:MAG: hypothetical protein E6J54_17955 [Deltaproteobacteria bacterium]|nr:MAG: hypothetical protein E6J54_17955 [Deltaproteobacteria bacterium]
MCCLGRKGRVRESSTWIAECSWSLAENVSGCAFAVSSHFHLIVEPAHQTAFSQFMQWLLTSHVRSYHKHYGGGGHIRQGRFKSFPVQRDEHLMTVLRYVLQNPVRAGSSSTVQEWLWSSVRRRHLVDRSPVDEAGQWSEQLKNQLGMRRWQTYESA